MARFSLSPPSSIRRPNQQQSQTPASAGGGIKSPPQWKWEFPPDGYYRSSPVDSESESDGTSSDDESESSESTFEAAPPFSSASDVYFADNDDDEEEEPPHPLGFESRYGNTRFGLSAESTAIHKPPVRDIFDRDDEYAWNALIHIDDKDNTYQGLSIDSFHLNHHGNSVSTKSLLRGASSYAQQSSTGREEDIDELTCGIDRIANLVKAASYVHDGSNDQSGGDTVSYFTPRCGAPSFTHESQQQPSATVPAPFTSPHAKPRSTSKLLSLAQACEQHQNALSQQMSQRIENEYNTSYKQSCQGFSLLLQADQSRVSSANERIAKRAQQLSDLEERERLEQLAYEEYLQKERELAHKVEEERLAADAAKTEADRIAEQEQLVKLKQAEEEAEKEAAKKTEHITRATTLITKLEEVRSTSLKEFDKSKSVSRRRLQFKKIVNGKINTLSHDGHKVLDVAKLVQDAIGNAANDDNAAAGGGDPVATLGKKYLLDLLCANLIVRVQADGFNGTRGDGFPLAGMFAHVSKTCDEMGPVLEGHLYTVCPTAIPTLSLTKAEVGESEVDLMESLGMIKNKNGEFESFDKFLHRTEGLISIMADIMSSHPTDHTLLGGHAGALTWLQRFLGLLPDPPATPLPLLTAPCLVAFLTGAGHMLANKYPAEFEQLFNTMRNDLVQRLDVSPVGVPSATRLRKVLDGGLEALKKELPKGAVATVYNGKEGVGPASSSAGASTFAQTSAPATSSYGFGTSNNNNSMGNSSSGHSQQQASSGFGAATPSPSPFGASGGNNNNKPPCKFFSQGKCRNGANCKFSHDMGGGNAAPAATSNPFSSSNWGSSGSDNNSMFGSSSTGPATDNNNMSTQPTAVPAPSPFGSFGASTAPAPSPFGGQPSSGFGNTPTPATSGFAPASSSGFNAPAPATTQQTGFGTFGASPAPAPGFGTPQPAPSSFGTFGTAAPAPAPAASNFGAFGTSPAAGAGGGYGSSSGGFGGGGGGFGSSQPQQTAGFGQQSQQQASSGFGAFGAAAPSPSPFAGAAAPSPSPFGASGGNNNNKPPCKFFSQGKCRNGANCKFSHDMGGGSGMGQKLNNSFGGMSNDKKQPCKFFAQGSCRHGNDCRFSHDQGSGGGSNAAFGTFGGSGGGSNPSPFGGNTGGFGSNPSPFGGSSNTGFGSSPFGAPRR